jgi:CMP/dCMP kinase
MSSGTETSPRPGGVGPVRPITVSGELGAGKSSVTTELARMLGARRVAMGDVQRTVADRLGLTILELNRYAETHPEIDTELDAGFVELARSGEPLVVDSRLAWHFLPEAYKVHLLVEPVVGASRVLSRGPSSAEEYGSLEEAIARTRARVESERRRFAALYGIDVTSLRNYDLVVDTTRLSADDVSSLIARSAADSDPLPSIPVLWIDPRRVLPTEPLSPDLESAAAAIDRGAPEPTPVRVGYSAPWFFVLDGHARLSAAVRDGAGLIRAELVAEGGEPVVDGISADDYVRSASARALAREWEDAHGFRFPEPPA